MIEEIAVACSVLVGGDASIDDPLLCVRLELDCGCRWGCRCGCRCGCGRCERRCKHRCSGRKSRCAVSDERRVVLLRCVESSAERARVRRLGRRGGGELSARVWLERYHRRNMRVQMDGAGKSRFVQLAVEKWNGPVRLAPCRLHVPVITRCARFRRARRRCLLDL